MQPFKTLVGLAAPLPRANLDTDVIYRKLLPAMVRRLGGIIGGIDSTIRKQGRKLIGSLSDETESQSSPPTGLLGEPWPVGTAALWAAILLVICLVMAFT